MDEIAYRLTDINTHCLAEFRKHWECLDNRNQQLWQCRPAEWKLSKCVYENLVRLPLIKKQPTSPHIYMSPFLTICNNTPVKHLLNEISPNIRNWKRRFPISPPTSPPLSCGRNKSSPT